MGKQMTDGRAIEILAQALHHFNPVADLQDLSLEELDAVGAWRAEIEGAEVTDRPFDDNPEHGFNEPYEMDCN